MQTLACSSQGNPVRADKASRGELYTCFECNRPLRLRSGRRRRPHFYHLSTSTCRLQMRSTFHLKIQDFLQQQLSPEKIILEQPFPTIRRIADLVWPAKRWIFEIQCSPISAMEVERRMADYKLAGYRVIWILFDQQFNRPSLSDAELFLQAHPYYFISKELFIYEQLCQISQGRRIATSKRYPIYLKNLDLNLKREWIAHQPQKPSKKSRFSLKSSLLYLLEKMTN